jgi:hypothetical protein
MCISYDIYCAAYYIYIPKTLVLEKKLVLSVDEDCKPVVLECIQKMPEPTLVLIFPSCSKDNISLIVTHMQLLPNL